ncbi:hypothetical protein [Streptomyces spectabilis]|uniref:Uncharacterized protein n=1 Tax=Streptomyces spectabilis TaxID=68270 RepID=A0A516RAZ5_STRST|nr:hypothetical protein [Streptomyces spectabilis]QDQ12822.1 hypothetical protein FH965_21490 [Streptomyces spectabilis]
MDHISDHVVRALWYIDLCAKQGQPLPFESIDRFAQQEPPRGTQRLSIISGLSRMFEESGPRVGRPDPVADYLLAVQWITKDDQNLVRLTKVGGAVLAASGIASSQIDAQDPEVADVALDPQDPLVYVQLTRRLQKAGQGLLVDAYFKAQSIGWLIESTNLRRVLISSRHRSSEQDRQQIAVALATVPNGSDLEVRHTGDRALHDRCVVGATGEVQLLGSSVNGVGKHLTAVITPSDDIAAVYRTKYEGLWQKATVVAPQPVTA